MNPIKPMLAVRGEIFSNKDWIFEPKIDGTRCIAHISNGTVELQNKRLSPMGYRYPEITNALKQAVGNCVLDGEMTVFSKGIPHFASLAIRDQQVNSIRIDYLSKEMPASYIVFDILYRGQDNLMNLPLSERKSILKKEVDGNDLITVIDYLQGDGEAYFKAAVGMGLEGVMAKRLASPYLPGIRSHDWIKIKKQLTLDLVIGGYIPGKDQGTHSLEVYYLGLTIRASSYTPAGLDLDSLKKSWKRFLPNLSHPMVLPSSTPQQLWMQNGLNPDWWSK
jgi:ATP-dependent DNA ligase